MICLFGLVFFFFKQKTAYEMRISDWSSDVCSSDLCTFRFRKEDCVPVPWACPAVIISLVACCSCVNALETEGIRMSPTLSDRYRGCLLGLACGDAVGTTVEFQPRDSFIPVTDMCGDRTGVV